MNYFFLCRFFLSFFLRLCVAILCRFRFLPQGTDPSPLFRFYINNDISARLKYPRRLLRYNIAPVRRNDNRFVRLVDYALTALLSSRGATLSPALPGAGSLTCPEAPDQGAGGINILGIQPMHIGERFEEGDLPLGVAPGVSLDQPLYGR